MKQTVAVMSCKPPTLPTAVPVIAALLKDSGVSGLGGSVGVAAGVRFQSSSLISSRELVPPADNPFFGLRSVAPPVKLSPMTFDIEG